jgi:hypothetical protein
MVIGCSHSLQINGTSDRSPLVISCIRAHTCAAALPFCKNTHLKCDDTREASKIFDTDYDED